MKNISIKESGLSFELNTTDFTASITSSAKAKGEVFIPRTITYEDQEYVIKTIKEGAFRGNNKIKYIKFSEDSEIDNIEKETFSVSSLLSITLPRHITQISKYLLNSCKSLKTVTIPEDSEIRTIESYSFSFTQIESLTFSEHIEKVEEGWCSDTSKLTKITISPENKNFGYLDSEHKLIGGKSNLKETDFDVLIFACRDVKTVFIPSKIKYIDSFAFQQCRFLEEVKFEEGSQLLSIGNKAFFQSTLTKFFIPSNVESIGESCFAETEIESIQLSSSNQKFALIEEKIIVAKSDLKNEEFDVVVFALDKFTNVVIPSFIKTIGPSSFYKNKKLNLILFSEDSQLEIFGENCFAETSLNLVQIPKSVKKIDKGSFSRCKELKTVDFAPLSELETIEEGSFYETGIESISIPEKVKLIGQFAFGQCKSLQEVLFPVDSQLELIDKNAFASSGIKTFYLPEKVKKIEEEAFVSCIEMSSFHFPKKGDLEIIEKNAFSDSSLESIIIPSYIKELKDGVFFNCFNLRVVEIPTDSELRYIGENAFNNCPLVELLLPPKVECIKKGTFCYCNNFGEIDFAKNSKLKTIEKNAFSNTLMEGISIPQYLQELSGKSFANVPLSVINIAKKNNFLKEQNENILLKKSDPKLSHFDIILLGYNQINEVKIQANIKHIASYAFYLNYDLSEISFARNSQLETIGRNCFVSTTIKSIKIPRHVKKIEKKTFMDCSYLKLVEFEDGSELTTIEKEAFCNSGIEKICFPPLLKNLDFCWCSNTTSLIDIIISPENHYFGYLNDSNNKIIVGKSNENIDDFDSIFFACKDIVSAKIPSNIKYIKSFAFDSCRQLKSVEFQDDSSLVAIEKNAFARSGIEYFFVPKFVKEIDDNAFFECKSLAKFVFHDDSQLSFIGDCVFSSTLLSEITIPHFVKKVGECLFSNCCQLSLVTFLTDKFYIDENLFENCRKLSEVSFPDARLVFKEGNPFKDGESDFSLNINGAELI